MIQYLFDIFIYLFFEHFKESLFRQHLDSGRDLGVTMCSPTTCAALLCLLAGAVAAVQDHQSGEGTRDGLSGWMDV